MAWLTDLPRALTRGWRRTSLRARLLGLMVVLVAVALFLTTAVGTRLLEGQLLDQVDQSLERSSQTVARFDGQLDEQGPGPGAPGRVTPSPVRVVTLDAQGNVVRSFGGELGQERSDPDVAGITRSEAEERGGEPFTVDSESGTGEWRVLLRCRSVQRRHPGARGRPRRHVRRRRPVPAGPADPRPPRDPRPRPVSGPSSCV